MAFVEPVGLTEFANDGPPGLEFAENQLADFPDIFGEGSAGGPVGRGQRFEVEREGRSAAKLSEVEFVGGEHPEFDGLGIGAFFGGGELVEESGERFRTDAVDVLDGAQGAVGALGEFAGEEIRAREKIGKCDLLLADFVEVGGGDAAAGGATRLFAEDLDAVIFGGEVEESVGEVGDHCALVDQEAGEDRVALEFEGFRFPPDLAWICDHAGPDAKVRGVADDDTGREEVELDATGGVPRVGTAIDLEDHRDGSARATEFVGHFGDEAALAFVTEGDSDIGDQLARKRDE